MTTTLWAVNKAIVLLVKRCKIKSVDRTQIIPCPGDPLRSLKLVHKEAPHEERG